MDRILIGGGKKIIKVETVGEGCADYCKNFKIAEVEHTGTDVKTYECENLEFCEELYFAIKKAEGRFK